MLASILFTSWIIVAAVSSTEVDKSTETSSEKDIPKNDENSSSVEEMTSSENDENDKNDEKDTSKEDKSKEDKSKEDKSKEDKRDEKYKNDEKDGSDEPEKDSSEETKETSDASEGEERSYIQDNKFTKTSTAIFKPGSILPPCAMCNFQSGGVFMPWSHSCPGCVYRPPMCSVMGLCCIAQPNCPVLQHGMPCPINPQLGFPMASGANPLVGPVMLTEAIPQITSSKGYQVGEAIPSSEYSLLNVLNSNNGMPTNVMGLPGGGIGTAGSLPTMRGSIPNNSPIHPVYQALGMQAAGIALSGGTVLNNVCPETKVACSSLGGTCIPLVEKCGGVYKHDEQLCGSSCKCCIRRVIKDCCNFDKNCLSWASAGYCSSYPQIKTLCKVSCGVCIPKPGDISPPESSTFISNQCKDSLPNCEAIATKDACSEFVNVRELCPKTCGITCTKTQALTQPKGGVCSHLTKNACNQIMNGHCIPLHEQCGGWFKQDPSLCGTGNCKCCIREDCNIKPEDSKICKHLGGSCVAATMKCKGSSYPLCGSDACQCCVDNPIATGTCPQKQACGTDGTCTLGGCRVGYEATEGNCPGPECYCCNLKEKSIKKAQTICSDKPCGPGGTCRETTCLPGEVRLKENCGSGSCVCCKSVSDLQPLNHSQLHKSSTKGSCPKISCGNGGKCRCTRCRKNEERIDGRCPSKKHTCLCCKPKNAVNFPVEIPTAPTENKKFSTEKIGYFQYPESLADPPPYLPPKDFILTNIDPSIPLSYPAPYLTPNDFREAKPRCRAPINNICQKKGGSCISFDKLCIGMSSPKYCGTKKTCQCCIPDMRKF